MSVMDVNVPDVGVDGEVEIIEICVNEGDSLEVDSPVVVIETDKATVEVPCLEAGKVASVEVKVGDKVSEGHLLIRLETDAGADDSGSGAEDKKASDNDAASDKDKGGDESDDDKDENGDKADKSESATETSETIKVPDLGGPEQVEVIEIAVSEGDEVDQDDTLLVLESDKASMEIPSPHAGQVEKLLVSVGDKVSEGDDIAVLKVKDAGESKGGKEAAPSKDESGDKGDTSKKTDSDTNHETAKQASSSASQKTTSEEQPLGSDKKVHAGPAVRKLARELGADLSHIKPTGPKKRILKEDLKGYIKSQVTVAQKGGGTGGALPVTKLPDFSAFGDVEVRGMEKIHRVTADNMQASWLTIPHVTQFDEADITEMESFRKAQKAEGEAKDIKLTPLAFLLKACAYVIQQLPQFNVSLDMQNAQIYQKKYIHIGVAVDTPAGLMVPVIRDVDKKSLWELASECQELAKKAKDRKLKPAEMQGGCFTISSLGGIGGTAFTPIVNAPEVAILGVSKASHEPVYNGAEFEPRLMLPLSLSYDHRAVNGADAARFTSMLGTVLGDLRKLLL